MVWITRWSGSSSYFDVAGSIVGWDLDVCETRFWTSCAEIGMVSRPSVVRNRFRGLKKTALKAVFDVSRSACSDLGPCWLVQPMVQRRYWLALEVQRLIRIPGLRAASHAVADQCLWKPPARYWLLTEGHLGRIGNYLHMFPVRSGRQCAQQLRGVAAAIDEASPIQSLSGSNARANARRKVLLDRPSCSWTFWQTTQSRGWPVSGFIMSGFCL